MNRPNPLTLSLSDWIIHDGNYPELGIGDELDFALCVYAMKQGASEVRTPALRHESGDEHAFVARVVAARPHVTVLDAGYLCYVSDDLGEPDVAAEWIEGRMVLSPDPFFWKESYEGLPGLPHITYRWRVERIHEQDFSAVGEAGPRVEELDRTRAGSKVGGVVTYELLCTCRGLTAERS